MDSKAWAREEEIEIKSRDNRRGSEIMIVAVGSEALAREEKAGIDRHIEAHGLQ